VVFALLAVLLVVFVVLPLVGAAIYAIVSTVIVGLIIGGLGRLAVPGNQPIGCLATTVAGLAGSVAGTIVGHAIHVGHLATILLEVGAAALLVLVISRSAPRLIGR
jgi:uncharacterized membrane protein YeaQ/YmgE (transglycosylase-associated protein family)